MFTLVPWFVVLANPDIRAQFLLQFDSLVNPNATSDSFYGDLDSSPDLPWYRLRPGSLIEMADREPADARLAFAAVDKRMVEMPPPSPSAGMAEYGRRRDEAMDEVIHRHPGHPWLLASRIRTTLSWFRDDRLADTYDDAHTPPLVPPPLKSTRPPNFSAEDLRRCIEVARRGQRAEPQNSFYDWWLAYFLFAGYRDTESLTALHRAALKTTYDDHSREELQAQMYAKSRVQILTAEGKAGVIASQPLQQYHQMRHFGLLLAWYCHEAKRTGRHAEALRVLSDVTCLGRLIREGGYSAMDTIVSHSLGPQVWRSVTSEFTPREAALGSDARARLRRDLTVAYARRHADESVAALVTREAAEIDRSRARMEAWANRDDTVLGLQRSIELPSITLWLGTQVLLRNALLLAGLGVVMLELAWPPGMEEAPAAPRDVWLTVAACWLLFALALVGMYFGGAGWSQLFHDETGSGAAWNENGYWGDIAALGGTLVPIILPAFLASGIVGRRRRQARRTTSPASPQTAGPTASARRYRQILAAAFRSAATAASPAGTTGFLSGKQFGRAVIALGIGMLYLATVMCAALLLYVHVAPPTSVSTSQLENTLRPVLAILAGLSWFSWVLRARWFQPPGARRASAHGVLRWYRGSLLGYLALTGWMYLALSLLNLGLRRVSSAEVDRYAEHGMRTTAQASQEH